MGSRDLREFIRTLEARGKLVRLRRRVTKEKELMPLFRLQFRGLPDEERAAFLFENVGDLKGRSYPGSVAAGVYGASREIFALGVGCEDNLKQLHERWGQALAHPLEPKLVDDGPVHEEVHTGEELEELGLGELPVPVEEPGFSGTVRLTSPFITKDPGTGIRNAGLYTAHVRGPNTLVSAIGYQRHAWLYHWNACKELRKPLPIAIVIGVNPSLCHTAAAPISYSVDELAVAGALEGEPLELVRCRTIDLEVPATAEIVVEGEMSTEWMEPGGVYGEYPGFMRSEPFYGAVVRVTCIAHRKNPIFTPFLVGFPPSDNHVVQEYTTEFTYYDFLTRSCGFPEVQEVAFHASAGVYHYCVVRLKRTHPTLPWQVMQALLAKDPRIGKFIIAVDENVDPKDPEAVNWALATAVQPHRDIQIVTGRTPGLDPSGSPMDVPYEQRQFPPPQGTSAILIDATRKWPYPPIALPGKEYMERALQIWQEEGLPPLRLKERWYGESLGFWPEEHQEAARLIVSGEHFRLGEKLRALRKRV